MHAMQLSRVCGRLLEYSESSLLNSTNQSQHHSVIALTLYEYAFDFIFQDCTCTIDFQSMMSLTTTNPPCKASSGYSFTFNTDPLSLSDVWEVQVVLRRRKLRPTTRATNMWLQKSAGKRIGLATLRLKPAEILRIAPTFELIFERSTSKDVNDTKKSSSMERKIRLQLLWFHHLPAVLQ